MFKYLAGPNRRLILAAMILGMVIMSGCGGNGETEEPVSDHGAPASSGRTSDPAPVQTAETSGGEAIPDVPDFPTQQAEAVELPWETDGLSDFEQVVRESLDEIAESAPGVDTVLSDLPWVADEVTLDDRLAVPIIRDMAAEDPALSRAVVDLAWLDDEISPQELTALTHLGNIAAQDPALARGLVDAPFLAEEVTLVGELTLAFIGDIAREDPALAQRMVDSPQVADGISGEELAAFTGTEDYYLERLEQENQGVAEILRSHPWVSGGVSQDRSSGSSGVMAMPLLAQVSRTPAQSLALRSLYDIANINLALAERLAGFPWVVDDVTLEEARALYSISGVARWDLASAQRLAGYAWLSDGITEDESGALSRLWRIGVAAPGMGPVLVGQPWFGDGISAEDAARVTVMKAGCGYAEFCRQLMETGQVESTAMNTASGNLEVFAVSRAPMGAAANAIFEGTRDVADALPDLLGDSWLPSPRVIIYLEPEFSYISDTRGFYDRFDDYSMISDEAERSVLYHEIAHAFSHFGPRWLREGGANLMDLYTTHVTDGASLESRRDRLASFVPCNGSENIHQRNLATGWMPHSMWLGIRTCDYTLGEHFLLEMQLTFGREYLGSSLWELRDLGYSGTSLTEELIHQVFLSNVPTGRQQEFQDLYDKLHGRPVGYEGAPVSDERGALIAFYHATGGRNWPRNRFWLSDAPLVMWEGVRTSEAVQRQTGAGLALWQGEDRSGSVIGIYVADNGLRGTLPAELGALEELRELFIPLNKLTGPIPPEIAELTNLESLWLNENQLTGPIPPGLGGLSNLRILNLSGNGLTGSIPPELGRLSDLEQLVLGSNQLTGPIPPELGNLRGLRRLILFENQLDGQIPAELGNLTELDQIGLGGNQFTGCVPDSVVDILPESHFRALGLPACGDGSAPVDDPPVASTSPSDPTPTSIPRRPVVQTASDREVLEVFDDSFGGFAPWADFIGGEAPLGEWPGVETDEDGNVVRIVLIGAGLSGSIPPELGNLVHLEFLQLPRNQLTGPIPPELGRLTNLRSLILSENQLTGPIPPELGNLSNLEGLVLKENQLSGPIPPELGKLTNASGIILSHNQLTGPLPPELGDLPNIWQLFLQDNPIEDECYPSSYDRAEKMYLPTDLPHC